VLKALQRSGRPAGSTRSVASTAGETVPAHAIGISAADGIVRGLLKGNNIVAHADGRAVCAVATCTPAAAAIPFRPMFEKRMLATWGDMDFNAHMRNTAYLDKSADLRLMFFAEHGVPPAEFLRLGIGPVVRKDEIEYFREVRLLDELRVTIAVAGLSDDGARFIIRNEFWRTDAAMAARVTSAGGWLDHRARKLVVPPESLQAALRALPRTDDFQPVKPLRD
jgi:acyl-CoA thioester hydrolase